MAATDNDRSEHYVSMALQSAHPALRTFYKDEKSFDVTVDDIALVVHGWIEAPFGSHRYKDYEPATVSINAVCWPGSDLDISQLLAHDVMHAIQGKVDDQAEGVAQ